MSKDKNSVYIVQGDLEFWGYGVFGAFSSRELAKKRISQLIDKLSDEEWAELTLERDENELKETLLIFELFIDNTENVERLNW